MILFTLIWIVFSILIAFLLARIIGNGPNMVLNEEDSSNNSDWLEVNTANQQADWDNGQYNTPAEVNSDHHLRNNHMMRISRN